jgi:2-polyprenyl-6-hydroxyphenyl methylase/3-demethylubiquinone-9 3-methyltransferase
MVERRATFGVMSIGSVVRSLFGPAEPLVARAYRRIFLDVEALARTVARHATPRRVLEVGAGEGQFTEALARVFPEAEIQGIDLTPRVGRLYQGPRGRVTFAARSVDEVAAEQAGQFDLVVVCDVLHHVPPPARAAFLETCGRCVAPGGTLVLKDWERTSTPIHAIAWFSDRHITQDRIAYLTATELRAALGAAFGPVLAEARIGPWRNNLALFSRRG